MNLGAALIISLDDDQDGYLSLDEFIEYAAVMVQLSDAQSAADSDTSLLIANLSAGLWGKPTLMAILRISVATRNLAASKTGFDTQKA